MSNKSFLEYMARYCKNRLNNNKMKLHFISMNATTRQVHNDVFIERETVYRIFEFKCFEKGFTILVDVYPKEKLQDKLKEILKEDFEIELPDAIIK